MSNSLEYLDRTIAETEQSLATIADQNMRARRVLRAKRQEVSCQTLDVLQSLPRLGDESKSNCTAVNWELGVAESGTGTG